MFATRCVLIAVLAHACLAAAPAGAGPAQPETRVYVLTRSTPTAPAVRFSIDVVATHSVGTVVFAGFRKSAGGRVAGTYLLGEFGGPAGPVAYTNGTQLGCGQATLSCGTPADGDAVRVGSGATDPSLDLWLVAARADVQTFSLQSRGWRVQRLDPSLFRLQDAAQGGATGIHAAGASAEAFSSASLPGGRHGSFALAHPPCEAAGAGSVTFSGGDRTWDLRCTPGASLFRGSQARAATRWELRGDMVGQTQGTARLAVLDLPSPAVCRCR